MVEQLDSNHLVQGWASSLESVFGKSRHASRCFFAPGRICLIGEHLDYNGGMVMPAAISRGIYGFIRKRDDKNVILKSSTQPGVASFSLEKIEKQPDSSWFNYPLGVVKYMSNIGFHVGGFEMIFFSDLPTASGLSSSAAIEVLTAFSIRELFEGSELSLPNLAQLCMKVENEFVGLPCGIMDQFASVMGKKSQAILLNCNNLAFEYVPFNTGEYRMIIVNTNKPRKLTESPFAQRKQDCLDALSMLQKKIPAKGLAQVSVEHIEKYITDPLLKKRALYFAEENGRVNESAEAMKKGDVYRFGEIMWKSHEGLQNKYEVTGLELDTIVDSARKFEGCIGARMTGAGFGGCAIALVHNSVVDQFKQYVKADYKQTVGIEPSFYETEIGNGVRELEIEKSG